LSLHIMAHCCLGETYYARGDYRRASDVLRQSVVALEGEVRPPSTSAMPSVAHHRVACRRWLVFSLAEEGVFAEGLTRGEEAVQYAEAEGHQGLLIQACLG